MSADGLRKILIAFFASEFDKFPEVLCEFLRPVFELIDDGTRFV